MSNPLGFNGATVATIVGAVGVASGIHDDNKLNKAFGGVAKAALDKVGITVSEKQATIAAGAILAAGGMAWLMMGSKDKDDNQVVAPTTPLIPTPQGQNR